MDDVFAGILIGGRGQRLGGCDKATLPHPRGGTYLGYLVSILQSQIEPIVLAGRRDQIVHDANHPKVSDQRNDSGPLAGLEALLQAAPKPWCFLLACDLPLFDLEVLQQLATHRSESVDAVVPLFAGTLQPTCALYATRLLPCITDALNNGHNALRRLLDNTRRRVVPFGSQFSHAFQGVNTPNDLVIVEEHWTTQTASRGSAFSPRA